MQLPALEVWREIGDLYLRALALRYQYTEERSSGNSRNWGHERLIRFNRGRGPE